MTQMRMVPFVLRIPADAEHVRFRTDEVAEALRRLGFRHVETSTTGLQMWDDHEEPATDGPVPDTDGMRVRPAVPPALFKPGPF